MKRIESRVPRFYDVLDEELENLSFLRALFSDLAREYGYTEMRTTLVELRERYLAATKVHSSRIFEVRRAKEGSRFALQADLAMSMSRFVADLPSAAPLKLAQFGLLYRDRQPDLPGYRREFEMAVLGAWGVTSPHADAELIAAGHRYLERVPGVSPKTVQITNHAIFERVAPGLTERVRFGDAGIAALADEPDVSPQDRAVLTDLFEAGRVPLSELDRARAACTHPGVRAEMAAAAAVAELTALRAPGADLCFSLADLKGTGHYSGLNYQIYALVGPVPEPLMVGDGGRIDHLCRLLNRRDIPAVCMGLGVGVLGALMNPQPRNQRVVILVDADRDAEQAQWALWAQRMLAATGFACSVMPLARRSWATVLRSEFYADEIFVLCEQASAVSVRGGPREARARVDKLLAVDHLGKERGT